MEWFKSLIRSSIIEDGWSNFELGFGFVFRHANATDNDAPSFINLNFGTLSFYDEKLNGQILTNDVR